MNIASQDGPAFSGTYGGQTATPFTLLLNGTIDADGNFTTGILTGDMGEADLQGTFGGRLIGDTIVLNYSGSATGCRVVGSFIGTKPAQ